MRIRSSKPELHHASRISTNEIQEFKAFGIAPPGREFLYRLYDTDRRLLYVGITWNPFVRWTSHKKTKPWWHDVDFAEVYLCQSDRDAREWETWCIKHLDPTHNKHQNPTWHRG